MEVEFYAPNVCFYFSKSLHFWVINEYIFTTEIITHDAPKLTEYAPLLLVNFLIPKMIWFIMYGHIRLYLQCDVFNLYFCCKISRGQRMNLLCVHLFCINGCIAPSVDWLCSRLYGSSIHRRLVQAEFQYFLLKTIQEHTSWCIWSRECWFYMKSACFRRECGGLFSGNNPRTAPELHWVVARLHVNFLGGANFILFGQTKLAPKMVNPHYKSFLVFKQDV